MFKTHALITLGLAIIGLTFAQAGQAQQRVPSTQSAGLPFPIQGPPPPVPPEVIARDPSGGVTARAVRLADPLRVDGRLEEAVYTNVASMSDFIQNDPVEGQPATEKTEVWIFFDDDNVYVVARCWESRPERLVADEMRRDNFRIVSNDNFAWMFDTFYDRRNGVIFEVSAVGGRIDAQVTNEQQINLDWNRRVFYRLLEQAGLRKIRLHDLRHTYASLLIQQGESLAYVQQQLGHSSVQVTVDVYGHLIPGANRAAVDRLDAQPRRNQREPRPHAEGAKSL